MWLRRRVELSPRARLSFGRPLLRCIIKVPLSAPFANTSRDIVSMALAVSKCNQIYGLRRNRLQLSGFLSPLTGEPVFSSLATAGSALVGGSGRSGLFSCATGDEGPELRPQPVFLFSEAHTPHDERYAPAR